MNPMKNDSVIVVEQTIQDQRDGQRKAWPTIKNIRKVGETATLETWARQRLRNKIWQ